MDKDLLLVRNPIFNNDLNVNSYLLELNSDRNLDGQKIELDQESKELFSSEAFAKLFGKSDIYVRVNEIVKINDYEKYIPIENLTIIIDTKKTTDYQQIANDLLESNCKICIANPEKAEDFAINSEKFIINFESLSNYESSSISSDKVIVANINNYDDYYSVRKQNINNFMGDFFLLPDLNTPKKVKVNYSSLTNLVTALNKDDVSIHEVEGIIASDPKLSFKLLRLINSAAFYISREITSLRDAIIYLGRNELIKWSNLILITTHEGKPTALTSSSLIRAKMCERIAEELNCDFTETYFTVGLFSNLDAMLDQSLEEILDEINLNDSLKQALLNRKGELGEVLNCAIAYEHGDWNNPILEDKCGNSLMEIYMESVSWAHDVISSI